MEKSKSQNLIDDPGPVLLAMVLSNLFDTDGRPPWACEKIEEFKGPGTDYVWQIYSEEDGECLTYLSSSVDAPAIVEKINKMEWEGLEA